jgi:PAS domain S-box-containing protein
LKEAQKVFAIAVIMGVSMWVIDAFVDAYIFYETSFVNSLIFHSAHELYFRLFFLIGCVIFGAVISRFVAKTKKAEEKLQNALTEVKEEKLRSEGILAAIADAISIQDTQFKILYQNQAHIDMLGNHAGEYCYRAYRGNDHVCENCHLSLSFRDGKIYTSEQSRPTDNGTYYYEIKSSPLKNSKGEIIAGIEAVRDITQRRRTEEFIEQSKKDWENTFDTIEDMITIHDKDFNIIRANRAAQKLHELPFSEILHTKCFSYYHGTETPPPNCPSCESLRTGFPSTHEFYEPFLNKHVEVVAIPRFDSNNEFSGLIHIVRDITKRKEVETELARHREHLADLIREKTADLTSAIDLLNDEITSRRQAEEALRVSEKKYRDLYNNAPDMYHTINRDKIIIDCNETEAKMLGYKKEEIIGRPLSDFFSDDSKLLIEQDFPLLLDRKVLRNLERTFVRKDGSTFEAILNVFATSDDSGQVTGSRAIARDITELKQSANELKNVNRTLKALSDFNYALLHVNDETALLSETCRIIVNTGSYRMAWVGYAENNDAKRVRPMAQAGDADGYLESVDITWDGQDPAKEPAGRAIITGETCISRTIKIDTRTNPWCPAAIERGYRSSIAIPLFENGTVIGSLSIYSGEPDAFDPEEIDLLESLAENLSYGIAVLRSNAERKRAEAEVMRAGHLASLGELAAGVAHEINNPINGIINYAELLIKKGMQDGKNEDIAARIIKEGDRIANIVRSLLSFARDTKEEKRPVRVNAILADTLSLTEAQLLKDGIHLQTDFPDDLPLLFAQPQQIEQVFLNVISNARHALNQRYPEEDSGKILNIRGLHVMENDRPYVQIVFHDRGTGIPDTIKDKIMNPFFSTKPGHTGTGLGLSISHGIVSDHNGKIVIESSTGNYTKVIVNIPAYVK